MNVKWMLMNVFISVCQCKPAFKPDYKNKRSHWCLLTNVDARYSLTLPTHAQLLYVLKKSMRGVVWLSYIHLYLNYVDDFFERFWSAYVWHVNLAKYGKKRLLDLKEIKINKCRILWLIKTSIRLE